MDNIAAKESIADPWAKAHCIGCGYALRGLPASCCPECGRGFDRANAATFNQGRHYGPFVGWLLRPTRWPSWLTPVMVACVVATQLIFFLRVDECLFILSLAWLASAGPYMFWSMIRSAVCGLYKQPAEFMEPDRRKRRRIARDVLIGALIPISQLLVPIPFWLSRPALDRYANHLYTEVPMLSPPSSLNRWCGLYYVHGCILEPNGVWMYVGGRWIMYCPLGPPHIEGWGIRQISGDWYAVESRRSFLNLFWPSLN